MSFMKREKQKSFLVINRYTFGDVIITNSLCQNIKLKYPDSKVVFVVQKQWEDVARYQKDVDDIVTIDDSIKTFWGMIKFLKNFPYKDIYASLIVYGGERVMLYSKLLGCKYRSE